MSEKTKGILLAIIGASAYGFMPFFTRLAMNVGTTSNTLLVYRFLFIFLFVSIYLMIRRDLGLPTKDQLISLLLFGAGGYGLAIFLLAESYRYLPTGQATMLHCSYPAFVALFMGLMFREKMTKRKAGALFLTGISLLLLMDFPLSLNFRGSFIAIVSSIAFAVYMVSVNQSVLRELTPWNLMLFLSVTVILVFGSYGLISCDVTLLALPEKSLLPLLAISLLSILGIGFMTLSIRMIGPTYAAMLSIFEPIVSLLCSTLLLHEVLSPAGIMGSFTMLGVLLLIARQ